MERKFDGWETEEREFELKEFAKIINDAKYGETGDGIDVFGRSDPEDFITDKLPDVDTAYKFLNEYWRWLVDKYVPNEFTDPNYEFKNGETCSIDELEEILRDIWEMFCEEKDTEEFEKEYF